MKKLFPAVALAVAALTLVPATSASAVAWDGSDIEFGLGDWEFSNSIFYVEDVYLVFPDTSTQYTDIWDGAAATYVSSVSLGLNRASIGCPTNADIDQSVDAGTGDLVLTCPVSSPGFTAAGLSIVAEIRVYAGSDLVRASLAITNTTASAVTIDSVDYSTDFGSNGDLYDYENQDDLVLAVPATESSDFSAQLNSVDAQWIVHTESDDAPGGIIIGAEGAGAAATWTETDGDEYFYQIGTFSIPAGQTRYTATFLNWDPQSLIAGDYTNSGSDPDLLLTSAAATVVRMSEFSSLTGRLVAGFPADAVVVNWVALPAVDAPDPELAATGTADAVLPATGGAAALLFLGALLVVAKRRSLTLSAQRAGVRS